MKLFAGVVRRLTLELQRLRQTIKPKPPSKSKRKSAKKRRKKKTSAWTVPTILGLLLSALTLYGLRPQIAISPETPLDNEQPFSVPFRISNAGYLGFHVLRPMCYIHSADMRVFKITRSMIHVDPWDNKTLDSGESETIECRMNAPAKTADIAIIVDYRPWGMPIGSFRRYERFVGEHEQNWVWTHQPSSEIRADADADIEYFDGTPK